MQGREWREGVEGGGKYGGRVDGEERGVAWGRSAWIWRTRIFAHKNVLVHISSGAWGS